MRLVSLKRPHGVERQAPHRGPANRASLNGIVRAVIFANRRAAESLAETRRRLHRNEAIAAVTRHCDEPASGQSPGTDGRPPILRKRITRTPKPAPAPCGRARKCETRPEHADSSPFTGCLRDRLQRGKVLPDCRAIPGNPAMLRP